MVNSSVRKAIALGAKHGIRVDPWGGDAVRLHGTDGTPIMSAAQAVSLLIRLER